MLGIILISVCASAYSCACELLHCCQPSTRKRYTYLCAYTQPLLELCLRSVVQIKTVGDGLLHQMHDAEYFCPVTFKAAVL